MTLRSHLHIRTIPYAAAMVAALVAGSLAGCSSDGAASEESAPASLGAVAQGSDSQGEKASASGYHDAWRRLWEDHITWTRVVILGILDSVPGTDAFAGRLLQNAKDMAGALAPYYGKGAADEFGALVKEHLLIAADILVAARGGDSGTVTARVADWRANADALAAKLHELNPKAFPIEDGKTMWQEHLDFTLQEATAHLQRDFATELQAWEHIHEGGLVMADMMSDGVMSQFPGAFSGCGKAGAGGQ